MLRCKRNRASFSADRGYSACPKEPEYSALFATMIYWKGAAQPNRPWWYMRLVSIDPSFELLILTCRQVGQMHYIHYIPSESTFRTGELRPPETSHIGEIARNTRGLPPNVSLPTPLLSHNAFAHSRMIRNISACRLPTWLRE